MRVLVVATEPIGSDQLREALGEDPSETEVLVISPALAKSSLRFWMSDVDEAIERADWIQRESVRRLETGGADASGDTGESEPLQAIEDALETFDADQIVVFARGGSEGRHHEDHLVEEADKRFGLPVVSRYLVS